MSSSVSRRSVLKWTGALAAVGVVGIGLGFGADLLLRPNTTKTVTQNNTQTQTSTQTQTNTATVTQPPVTITQTNTTTSTQQEVLLTSAWDAGPFIGHVVNGVWTKSTPLQPNIPGSMTMFGARNRTVALDRILYPLQRVDFSTSNRNTQKSWIEPVRKNHLVPSNLTSCKRTRESEINIWSFCFPDVWNWTRLADDSQCRSKVASDPLRFAWRSDHNGRRYEPNWRLPWW